MLRQPSDFASGRTDLPSPEAGSAAGRTATWLSAEADESSSSTAIRSAAEEALPAPPVAEGGRIPISPPERTGEILDLVTASPARIGRYEILGEIARGGMGVVYRARQPGLGREVALKMTLGARFAGEEERQRFLAEAQAAGMLNHPAIVPIFEIGEHEGQLFFSMGLIEGASLRARLVDGPFPPEEAARLIQSIAAAVQYAHDQGVVHRDLKPANILLDQQGCPHVTDFGLAKRTAIDSSLTATGQVLGTPSYMPPEQAAGRMDKVGPTADVYSLGATLYNLLTGRPPFQASTVVETLSLVLDSDPVTPRRLNPAVPHDLETICLKCLRKAPESRYATAAALADDLGRFVRGEPILARPVRRVERAAKWCRRNRTAAGLIAVLMVSAIGGFWLARREAIALTQARNSAVAADRAMNDAKRSEGKAKTAAALASQNAEIARAKEELARQRQRDAEQARGEEAIAKQAALIARRSALDAQAQAEANERESRRRQIRLIETNGLRALEERNPITALPWFVDALALESGNREREEVQRRRIGAILDQAPRLVGQWREYVQVEHVEFSTDGSQVMSWNTGTKAIQVRDSETGEPVGPRVFSEVSIHSARLLPRRKELLTIDTTGCVRIWDPATGLARKSFYINPNDPQSPPPDVSSVRVVHFPDLPWFVTTSNDTAQVWDADTGLPRHGPVALDKGKWISSVDHTSEPDKVLFFCNNQGGPHQAWKWNLVKGEKAELLSEPREFGLLEARMSLDRTRFLLVDRSGSISLHSSVDGKEVWRTPPRTRAKSSHNRAIISPNLSHVALYYSDTVVELISVSSDGVHTVVGEWPGSLIDFHSLLILRGYDGAVNLLNPRGQAATVPLPQAAEAKVARFHGMNGKLVIGDAQGIVRLWDVEAPEVAPPTARRRADGMSSRTVHAGRLVSVSNRSGQIEFLDLTTHAVVGPPIAGDYFGRSACVSPDGAKVAGEKDGKFRIWKLADSEPVGEPMPLDAAVNWVEFSPDSRRLLTWTKSGLTRVWDAATAQPITQPFPSVCLDNRESTPLLTPDGQLVITLTQSETGEYRTIVHDVTSDRPLGQPIPGYVGAVSLDGRLCVLALKERVSVREVRTMAVVGPSSEYGALKAAQFSPDSRRVAIARADGLVQIAQIATNDDPQQRPVDLPRGEVTTFLAFDPSGRFLATITASGLVRVWNSTDGTPVAPAFRMASGLVYAEFSDDGRRLATLAVANQFRVWDWRSGTRITLDPVRSTAGEYYRFARVHQSAFQLLRPRYGLHLFDPPPDDRPLRILKAQARLLAMQSVDADGALAPARAIDAVSDWLLLSLVSAHIPGQPALSDTELDEAMRRERLKIVERSETRPNIDWITVIEHLDELIGERPEEWSLYWRRARGLANLSQFDRAARDLETYITGTPEPSQDSLYLSYRVNERLRRFDKLVAPLDRLLAQTNLPPQEATILRAARANALAETSQWERAADEYATLAKAFPTNLEFQRCLAEAQLADANLDGYRTTCIQLMEAAHQVATFDAVIIVARSACRDIAHSGVDPSKITTRLRELLGTGDAGVLKGHFGQAEYCAGHFDVAARLLQEHIQNVEGQTGMTPPGSCFLLAMTFQRMDRPDEARKLLEKGRRAMTTMTSGAATETARVDWITWDIRLARDALWTEARELIGESPER